MSAPGTTPSWIPRKRRTAELGLLVLAILIGIGSYAAVGLGLDGSVPPGIYTVGAVYAIVALGAHLAVRRFAGYADPVLLPLVVSLNGIGLVMIYRIDLGLDAMGSPYGPFAQGQLRWTVLGILMFVAVLVLIRDHRRLQQYTYTFGLAAIALLILPILPVIGNAKRGAQIWIQLGPFSFQPAEAAKIALAIFFAGYLVAKRDALALAGRRFLGVDLPRGRDLGPILLGWLISVGILVFQRDLGSSLLFFGLFVVMLYVATERPGWLFVGTALFAVGAWFGYAAFGHVRQRFDAWLDPWSDPDQNYQLITALYGLGHGGLLGRGWGEGSPELTPFGFSDFILSSIGEELGLTGFMAVIVIYGLIVERGLRIALTCRDAFGKLLAVGLSVSFALQVFVVAGGVTRLIPLTGLTAPFLAAGGSSIIMNWIIVALLLRISDQTRRPAPEVSAISGDDDTQVVKLS
jgi:cell division protein FtsW (lipid II flippase)